MYQVTFFIISNRTYFTIRWNESRKSAKHLRIKPVCESINFFEIYILVSSFSKSHIHRWFDEFIFPWFRWLKPLLATGLKRDIQEDDIYAVNNDMRSDSNTEAFAKLWELECKKPKPSLLRILVKMYLGKVIFYGFLVVVSIALGR